MITQDQIEQKFNAASKEVQDMVNSEDVFNAFHEIREKHNLHLDHAGNLATAINAVILEIVPFTELDGLLREGMQGVDDATRQGVIQDVNDKIFVPLRALSKKRAEEKHAAEKMARVTPQKPSIRDVEVGLKSDDLPIRTLPKMEAPPSTAPEPALSEPNTSGSVLAQKLAEPAPSAPTPPPTPAAAPRYHGTDPYRELAE